LVAVARLLKLVGVPTTFRAAVPSLSVSDREVGVTVCAAVNAGVTSDADTCIRVVDAAANDEIL
jgi:hypothetical protein